MNGSPCPSTVRLASLLLALTGCSFTAGDPDVEDAGVHTVLEPLQVSRDFARQFSKDTDEELTGIEVDAQGNVFVSGNREGVDGFLHRYDASGAVLWRVKRSAATIDGIALDEDGNVYTLGWFTSGVWPAQKDHVQLVKYDPSGATAWAKQFTVPVVSDRTLLRANAIASDFRGGDSVIILFERILYPYQTREVVVRKYNSSGGLKWEQSVGSSSPSVWSPSLATDTSGNVYVTTNRVVLQAWNSFLVKLDGGGGHQWTVPFFPETSSQLIYAHAVAADAAGHVYVAGITRASVEGDPLGSDDAFLRKLDPSGAVEWTRQYGTASSDYANDLALDGSGGVYVAGSTMGGLRGANRGSYDAYVRHFDASGSALFTHQFGTSEQDTATRVSLGAAGGLYMGGETRGDLFKLPDGGTDVYFVANQSY